MWATSPPTIQIMIGTLLERYFHPKNWKKIQYRICPHRDWTRIFLVEGHYATAEPTRLMKFENCGSTLHSYKWESQSIDYYVILRNRSDHHNCYKLAKTPDKNFAFGIFTMFSHPLGYIYICWDIYFNRILTKLMKWRIKF